MKRNHKTIATIQAIDDGDLDLVAAVEVEKHRYEKYLGYQTYRTWRLMRCGNELKQGGQG